MFGVGHHDGAVHMGDVAGQLGAPPCRIEADGDRPPEETGAEQEEELGDVVEQDAHVGGAALGVGVEPMGVVGHGCRRLVPRPVPPLEDDAPAGVSDPRGDELGGRGRRARMGGGAHDSSARHCRRTASMARSAAK